MKHSDQLSPGAQENAQPSADPDEVVIRPTPDVRVGLSRKECRRLYGWLGDRAPFVRHQLWMITYGGPGGVSLATAQERGEVLEAIESAGRGRNGRSLTAGLLALKDALASGKPSAAREKS